MLPSLGSLLIAFKTDNPGAWLLHCHIGWHTAQGFALTFVEGAKTISQTVDETKLDSVCKTWKTFAAEEGIKQLDSGV
jgi:hypothetical protein